MPLFHPKITPTFVPSTKQRSRSNRERRGLYSPIFTTSLPLIHWSKVLGTVLARIDSGQKCSSFPALNFQPIVEEASLLTPTLSKHGLSYKDMGFLYFKNKLMEKLIMVKMGTTRSDAPMMPFTGHAVALSLLARAPWQGSKNGFIPGSSPVSGACLPFTRAAARAVSSAQAS